MEVPEDRPGHAKFHASGISEFALFCLNMSAIAIKGGA
jgi:hypothetical protein